jgi:hypothetical protein
VKHGTSFRINAHANTSSLGHQKMSQHVAGGIGEMGEMQNTSLRKHQQQKHQNIINPGLVLIRPSQE